MFRGRFRNLINIHNIIRRIDYIDFLDINNSKHHYAFFSTGSNYIELPKKLKKSERKPWVTSITELKRKARLEKRQRRLVTEVSLAPPENGLLVKALIPVAHEVMAARAELFDCVSKVLERSNIYSCSVCGEVHVGHPPHKIRTCNVVGSASNKEHTWQKGGIQHILPVVDSFHLYDRLGRAVSHNERLQVDRIPAIVELCVQAGVDMPEFLTRRREFPVYHVAGKMFDFERRFPKDELSSVKAINPFGFWENKHKSNEEKRNLNLAHDDIQGFAIRGMEAWEKMRSGAKKLMTKFAVWTCGYCPEVQVGPGGHRVRLCQAFKHQMRDGQHAWQEATVDDLVPPVYVWHVRSPATEEPLVDRLKKYYGKLPAVVELFGQRGARVGDNYSGLMREDIAVPGLDEEKWVV